MRVEPASALPEAPELQAYIDGLIEALRRSDPASGLGNADFDAIELYNRASLALYLETRADYFALLHAGLVKTATGNSDSHSLAGEPAGAPPMIHLAAVHHHGAWMEWRAEPAEWGGA